MSGYDLIQNPKSGFVDLGRTRPDMGFKSGPSMLGYDPSRNLRNLRFHKPRFYFSDPAQTTYSTFFSLSMVMRSRSHYCSRLFCSWERTIVRTYQQKERDKEGEREQRKKERASVREREDRERERMREERESKHKRQSGMRKRTKRESVCV